MIEGLLELDRALFLDLNSFHHPWLNPVMKILSGQGIWAPLIILAVWTAFKQFGRRTFWLFCLFLVLTIVVSDVTSSYILKNIFDRLRPCRELDLKPLINFFGQKCGGKFGFVSSHAANSLALVLFTIKTVRFRFRWLFILLAILVSYSRIYLGSHYPGDILGGFVVGAVSGFFFVWLFRELDVKDSSLEKSSRR